MKGVRIYLDHHATTPLDPRVLDAMMPYLTGKFGNAASRSHSFGWEAEKAVEKARRQVAELAGSAPREIVFTSGATESNNLAIKGVREAQGGKRRHIVTMATEHRAVLDPIRHLEKLGCVVTILPPHEDGLIDLDRFRNALRPDTALASVMSANNEIGVVQPVREIGVICRERGVSFHCDAAQAFGKVPIHVDEDHIDLMSLSAHKLYGPKGVGALYVRRRQPRVTLAAQMDGGGHEFGFRSGTLNVPAIVGFGEACAIARKEMADEAVRTAALRDRLLRLLQTGLDDVFFNGSMMARLPGNLNVSFAGVEADTLLLSMPEIALSTGSACSSASPEPSHVLRAINAGSWRERSAVRFGIGRGNTEEELDFAAGRVVEAVKKLRALTPA